MNSKDRELKIIAKFKDGEHISPANVVIYLDNEPVGAVQDFVFKANAYDMNPQIEITFPDLHSNKINPSYYKSANLVSTVDYWMEKFKAIFGINVKLIDIFKDD